MITRFASRRYYWAPFMITHNVHELTEEEENQIRQSEWYVYGYGTGVIMLDNCVWSCDNSVEAKEYLDELGKVEKG